MQSTAWFPGINGHAVLDNLFNWSLTRTKTHWFLAIQMIANKPFAAVAESSIIHVIWVQASFVKIHKWWGTFA